VAAFPSRERGFILIAALWLLILSGSIAALLMLRAVGTAREAAGAAEALAEELALEAAIETAAADLVMNGPRSRWAAAPSEAQVALEGRTILVRVTSESGKLDLNEADPRTIDRLLAGLGWSREARTAALARIEAARTAGDRLRSLTELRGLGEACLERYATIFSGRPEPEPAHMPPGLARLIGTAAPAHAGAPAPVAPGTPIRIEARTQAGASLAVTARIAGPLARPWSILAWERNPACDPSSPAPPHRAPDPPSAAWP
jgi:general secretion pathway protein K